MLTRCFYCEGIWCLLPLWPRYCQLDALLRRQHGWFGTRCWFGIFPQIVDCESASDRSSFPPTNGCSLRTSGPSPFTRFVLARVWSGTLRCLCSAPRPCKHACDCRLNIGSSWCG